MQLNQSHSLPKDGIAGLKENFLGDLLSGFMVSLIALPLSLGVAKASDFPSPIYGVITSIIGGIFVSLISGSRLTIKGPAAGLIVIIAGSVADFGGGETGWRLTLGAIVAAGFVQLIFGFLKLGRFAQFFPMPVVRGMLTSIGLIILFKQLHILMGANPADDAGNPLIAPLDLLKALPQSLSAIERNLSVFLTGLIGIILIFGVPLLPGKKVKKIPIPLLVLAVSIGLGLLFDLEKKPGALIHFHKSFTDILGVHADFSGWNHTFVFIKYVLLISVVGTLESLLIVNAIDTLDPYHRKSDNNREMVALGGGNMFAGILGGLPMISEVARSSANITYGAKTRWANFFHGFFLLIFMLLLIPFIEMIPNAALAALLIGIGYKLAHPKEFVNILRLGGVPTLVFLITIVVTLGVDLLVGVLCGAVTNIIIQRYQGKSFRSIFSNNKTAD